MFHSQQLHKGFSLIEVIIVISIVVMIFSALFGSFELSLRLINLSRSKLSAVSLANERMEYFRSLPYDDVGTILGIVPGTIPQNSTLSLNGIEFSERVLVQYVDDPADGVDPSDSNDIPSDYKQIKLEYRWELAGLAGEIEIISDIVPPSIETTLGGGSVRINVIDENSVLLPGASVRLINSESIPAIDVTRFVDSNGTALFSGAPAASNYKVIVTGPIAGEEYSIDQTYESSVVNPNPIRAPFSVIEADISTLTFQIGELSDLSVALKTNVVDGIATEDFSSLAALASSSNVSISSSELTLLQTAGVYETEGEVYLAPVAPATLVGWQAIRPTIDLPVGTTYRLSLYTGPLAGPYTLVPDTDLPGNTAGFSDSIIDISALDPGAYPVIIVGLILETSNTAFTPFLDEVGIFYRESETVLGNENFTIYGEKRIGTDLSASPIYKFSESTTTEANGQRQFSGIEFDVYRLNLSNAYDIAQGCPLYPLVHSAGVVSDLEIVLVPNALNSLRVSVFDETGRPIPGAELDLSRSGHNDNRFTGWCGQALLTGTPTAQVDFDLTVSATGYQEQTVSNITIDGDTLLSVTLNPA